MNIEDYLNTEEFKSRSQLCLETGLSDRALRDKISTLKTIKPVLYNSQTRGYRLAKQLEGLSKEELINEIKEIRHSLNDMESRRKVFAMQERSFIAYDAMANRFLSIALCNEMNGKQL